MSDEDRRLETILAARGLNPGARALGLVRATWQPGARETVPTWRLADLAGACGAEDALGLGLCLASSYAAAHRLDDLADENASGEEWALGSLDAVRLLALARACLATISGISEPARAHLGAELDRLQLGLCDGQEADLHDRERLVGDPMALARAKAGVGLGGYLAMAAHCVPGRIEVDRWRRAGTALGTVGQLCSDVFDLMAQPESADWAACLPNALLRLAMDAPCGPTVRLQLAGPRAMTWAPARAAIAEDDVLWGILREVMQGPLEELRTEAAADPRLRPLLEQAEAMVQSALQSRAQVQPVAKVRLEPWAVLQPRSSAFLAADPALEEAVVVHRWGMGGEACVRADVFLRLVVLDMLGSLPEREAVHGELPALVARARSWGWRYFGSFARIPPDIDTTGLALRVMATQGAHLAALQEADLAQAVATILDDPRPDGLLSTWRPHPRCVGSWPWDDRPCAVATTNALVGLHCAAERGLHGAWTERAARALETVTEWALAGGTSALYPQAVAEGWTLWGLVRLRTRGETGPAERALVERIRARTGRQGRSGSALDTALGLAGLRAAGVATLEELHLAAAALGHLQNPDGGYAADPFYPSVAPGLHGEPATAARLVGSRLVSTAVVARALQGCEPLLRGARAAQRRSSGAVSL